MYFPVIHERVRVSGREGDFLVLSVDYTACVAGLCPWLDGDAIQANVPFAQLSPAPKSEHGKPNDPSWEERLASGHQLVRTARMHIANALILDADLRRSLRSTIEIIHQSRRLVDASDRIIERARTLDCEE